MGRVRKTLHTARERELILELLDYLHSEGLLREAEKPSFATVCHTVLEGFLGPEDAKFLVKTYLKGE